ncbi:hypothetical protein HAX54_016818 [Datura stramonium]|uniref:Uncharacterized protein n=1 Tax=Datura stramonium TaxID=4076 RepID=A0ABS8ULA6_DATST|nr:hypothetical protein [Datura stramonium]
MKKRKQGSTSLQTKDKIQQFYKSYHPFQSLAYWFELVNSYETNLGKALKSYSNVPPDGSSSSVLSSLMTEIKDVKETLGAVAGDLHKSNESLNVLISSVAKLKTQLTLLQHEGVKLLTKFSAKSTQPLLKMKFLTNELAVAVQNSYSSLSTRIEKSYHSFSERIINMLKYFLGHA